MTKTLRKVIHLAEYLPAFYVPETESVMVKGSALSDNERRAIEADGHPIRDNAQYKIDYIKNIEQDHRIAMKFIHKNSGLKGLCEYFVLVDKMNAANNEQHEGLNLGRVPEELLNLTNKTLLKYALSKPKRNVEKEVRANSEHDNEAASNLSNQTEEK